MTELPDVTLHDMAKDYWRAERQGKYFGAIRLKGGLYTAWHNGQQIGAALTLTEAALLFKEIR